MSKKHFFHLLDAFQEIADMKGKGDWASQQIKEIKDKYENENDIFNNDDKKAEVSESFETNKEVIYFDNYQKRKAWDMLGLENLIDASYDDVVNFDWGVESLIENGNEIKWSLFIEGVDDLKILTQEELNNITPITDIKEKSPGKFYIGIWDDAKEDFIEFKEFNSFGDALKFASEYDYSGIKSGVVKFDTNSLFTKGFAGEFDIVDGDTDLDEMQRLMPIKEELDTSGTVSDDLKFFAKDIHDHFGGKYNVDIVDGYKIHIKDVTKDLTKEVEQSKYVKANNLEADTQRMKDGSYVYMLKKKGTEQIKEELIDNNDEAITKFKTDFLSERLDEELDLSNVPTKELKFFAKDIHDHFNGKYNIDVLDGFKIHIKDIKNDLSKEIAKTKSIVDNNMEIDVEKIPDGSYVYMLKKKGAKQIKESVDEDEVYNGYVVKKSDTSNNYFVYDNNGHVEDDAHKGQGYETKEAAIKRANSLEKGIAKEYKIEENFDTKKVIWPHELAKELRKRKKMGRSMLEIPNAGNVLVGNAIFNMAMGSDGGSSVGCSEGGLSTGGGTGVSESLEEENNHLDKCHVMKVVANYRANHNLPAPTDEEIDELISILEPSINNCNGDKQILTEINEDEVEDNGKIINTIQQCQKNPIDPTQSPAGKKLTTLQGVKEDKVLEEGAMADLDLKIKDVKKQIAETKDFLKFLRTQAPKEINKGGNFDSMEEVEEAIEENRNNLNTLIKELEDLEVKGGLR